MVDPIHKTYRFFNVNRLYLLYDDVRNKKGGCDRFTT